MYGGLCQAEYFRSCLELRESLIRADVPHTWDVITNESLIPRARNNIASTFLKSDYRNLMFIDGDIEFDPVDVAKLWNMDAPVSVGAYSMKRDDQPKAAWLNGEIVVIEDCPEEPFSVDYAGTGFMLIHREVFEKLKSSVPEYENDKWAFFQETYSSLGELSEDYFFCEQVRKAGYEIICDPTIKLTHWGRKGY